jgi:endonuclease YncB( thermonuclease family)
MVTLNRKQSRLFSIGMVVFILGVCLALTYGVAPGLRARATDGLNAMPLYRVMNIVSGDTLELRMGESNQLVRLVGIEAPAMEGDPRVAEQAARWTLDPVYVAQNGVTSRNTLSAWIYRRSVFVAYPFGEDTRDAEGRLQVQAQVAGVDVASKLLQGGQVVVTDEIHPDTELYRRLEQEARTRQAGLWRARE